MRQVVAMSARANGLKRVIRVPGKGAGTRRNDGTRGRETALPCRVPAVLRRHGESGAAGTVAASAAVDLRHQTLAGRPETAWRVRRSLPRLFAVSGVWLDD
jgi:hypothetical protein